MGRVIRHFLLSIRQPSSCRSPRGPSTNGVRADCSKGAAAGPVVTFGSFETGSSPSSSMEGSHAQRQGVRPRAPIPSFHLPFFATGKPTVGLASVKETEFVMSKKQGDGSPDTGRLFGGGYPPLLTVNQTAELVQIPKKTIYEWSSRGLLQGCSCRAGRHLRIHRDGFLTTFINGGFSCGKTSI